MSQASDLTLWTIEQSLLELVAAAEEVADDPALTPEQRDEELEAVRSTLADYVKQEVQKADGIRQFLLHCRVMADAAREEREKMNSRVRLWEAREARLKEATMAAMDLMQKKRVEGRTGSLSIRGNGGLAPLVIDNPALVPDEQCVWTGQISGKLYRQISMAALTDPNTKLERKPDNALIREALAEVCPECGGTGNSLNPFYADPCQACGGSGHKGVPGCRLGERGRSLTVK